jgi:hypothetical protein
MSFGRGHYAPYPVKDPTAAERVVLAGRAYGTALEGWVQRALTPPRPGGGRPDDETASSLEFAERLGRWSHRWQEAQDNAARSLAGRYQALSDHLARMTALENGRFGRAAVPPAGALPGRPVGSKSPDSFAEIARFFRPVDEPSLDAIVPELVEFERPLNLRGIVVTPAERVEIAGRAYRAVLEEAVARFLSAPRAGEPRRDEGAIFDTRLAERLGLWSDLWRRAEDAAAAEPSARPPAGRDRSARLAWAGTRFAGLEWRLAAVQAHVERMSGLESGRSLEDALQRAGRPAVGPIDPTRLTEFVAVARFFRIEAECQLPASSRPQGPEMTASSRAEAARRIYQAILDGAVRRHREAPPNGRPVLDARLAERLGDWSIRWGRAQAGEGAGPVARFAAIRSHIEQMAELEDGRALHDARARAEPRGGAPATPAIPVEFAEVARFFRLEALWELERMKAR